MDFFKNRKDLKGNESAWKVIVREDQVKLAVEKCANHINEKFQGKDVVVACILKGAAYFFVDLTRKLVIPHSCYFIEASSYGNCQNQENVEVLSRIVPSKFQGRQVVLIDELIDNGRTLSNVKAHICNSANVSESDIYTLTLFKKKREIATHVDYFGLLVPDVWLVGCGLDDQQEKRNWPLLFGCPKAKGAEKTKDDLIFESEQVYQFVLHDIDMQL